MIFESAEKRKTVLFQKIQTELRDLIGGEPVLVTRTVGELDRMQKAAPFTCSKAGKPPRKPSLPLVEPKEALEAVAMTDREVFIVRRRKKNGFYGFPNNFIEKELGVPATTRNWSTVTKILAFVRREREA